MMSLYLKGTKTRTKNFRVISVYLVRYSQQGYMRDSHLLQSGQASNTKLNKELAVIHMNMILDDLHRDGLWKSQHHRMQRVQGRM